MNRSIPIFLCLLLSLSSFQLFGQKGSKLPPVLKQHLDSSLYEHFQGQVPHHFCPCNNCEHWYSGKFSITKTGRKTRAISETEKEERIALWGKAGADQYSPFGSSKTVIQFYAEYVVLGEEYQLTLLKWKQSDCMQYLVLVDEPLKKMDDLSEDIADIEDKITNQILNAEEEEQADSPIPSNETDDQEGEILDWASGAEEGNLEGNESWEEIADEVVEPDTLMEEPKPVSTETAILARLAGPAPTAPIAIPEPQTVAAVPMSESNEQETIVESVADDEMIEKSILEMSATASVEEDPLPEAEMEEDAQESEEDSEKELTRTPIEQFQIESKLSEAEAATLEEDPQARMLSLSLHNPTEIKYKDAVVELRFVTKTETVLKTESHTIYEYFPPGEATSFSLDVSLPEHAQDVWVKLKELAEVE